MAVSVVDHLFRQFLINHFLAIDDLGREAHSAKTEQ